MTLSAGTDSSAVVGHVYEAGVVALEGDNDIGSRPVAVFGDDEVGFAGAGGLALVGVLTVEEDDDVGVLLEAVVESDAFGYEVVGA